MANCLLVLLQLLVACSAARNPRCNCERRPSSSHHQDRELGEVFRNRTSIASAPLRSDLPQNFDWSSVAETNFLVPSWNQHIPTYCGSCYAHATLNSVQDRIKVAKNAQAPDVTLARQSFLNCGPSRGYGDGCGGGNPEDIYNFMMDIGLPDESCMNYVAVTTPMCDAKAMCMNCMVSGEGDEEKTDCWPVPNYTAYKVYSYGSVSGEAAMQAEIFERGPIVCGFISDENFDFNYSGGVWTAAAASQNMTDINHDVEITGWGVTADGLKFWKARNSWGTYWGDRGFFMIERGFDLNRIESDCSFSIVDITGEIPAATGQVVGSMYGLVPQRKDLAKQSTDFTQSLAAIDWADSAHTPWPSNLPPRQGSSTIAQHQQQPAASSTSSIGPESSPNGSTHDYSALKTKLISAGIGLVAGAVITFLTTLAFAKCSEVRRGMAGYTQIDSERTLI